VNSDKISDYQGEDATQYESQAVEIGWHGHEILFGLMYEFVKPDETLLDIGIGTGLSSSLFHKAGLQISGFDNSTEMLEGCKSKGFSGEIIQHDLRNVPFPYEIDSFNHVISLAVLNFFAALAPVFKEVARIIKSKGIFGFTIEEKKPEQKAQYTMRVNKGTDQANGQFEIAMYRHSDEHIRDLLESVGFFVLKDFEFLADRYPEQGIEVYLKVYIAQKRVRLQAHKPTC
jgi:predicted TPR repeat methyltransferase